MSIVSFFRSALRPLLLLGLVLSAAAAFAQSPSADDGYNPNVDGNVYVMATQPDGKLLVAGQFATIRPSLGASDTRNNLARLNPDGSLDLAFNPNVNGVVRALVLNPDGTILIGGDFTSVGTTTRNRVARLRADGTVDAFNPNIVIPAQPARVTDSVAPQINALAVQPNGKVVVGGRFAAVQPGGGTAAVVTRYNVARFNADGSLDTAYNPNPNSVVLALVSHLDATNFSGTPRAATGDGKIVIAGGFTSLKPNTTDTTQVIGSSGVTGRNRIARLNADGTVDSEFDPNANNAVATLAVQRDGKIVLGGSFTTLQPLGNDTAASRSRIARLNADGTLDSEFYPTIGGSVVSVAIAPDGDIMVGGYFTSVWGKGTVTTTRTYVARFNPDGSLDTGFNSAPNYAVAAFGFQPDGKIVLGGYFTAVQSKGLSAGIPRNRLARVNGDGTLDNTLSLDAGGRPLVTFQLPNGQLLIGGSFTSVGGLTRPYLARLNADGSLDASFVPDAPNGRVLAIARESSGKIIIGGTFTLVGGTARNYIARLDANGKLDTAYDPNTNGQVGVLLLQSDGKLLVGGNFTTFLTAPSVPTYVTRSYLARLDANGVPDSFDPGPNSTVSSIAIQPADNKILLAGAFTAFVPNAGSSTTSRSYIARLNTDGLVDTTFTPLVNARATSLALQSDGKIVVGGQFTLFQPPGDTSKTTTVNGVTTTVSTAIDRKRLLRLNADGTYDTAFDAGEINNSVLTVAIQADGKIVAGGSFLAIQPTGKANDWNLRKYVARFDTSGKFDPTFNLDLNESNGNRVDSITFQTVGTEQKLIVGGSFTSLAPSGANRTLASQYVRINANGSLDTAFKPGAGGASGGTISAMSLQSDGKIVAVGDFADIGGTHTANVARFFAEGTADPTFSSSLDANAPVTAVLHRPDSAPVATQANGLAWLNTDGSLRTSFRTTALTGKISVVAPQADGGFLLGGSFSNAAGTTGNKLVRITPGGVVDTSFSPSPDGDVASLAVQSDGKILVGGSFTTIAGATRNYLARLNANGTIDTAFDPNANARVDAIVVQTDGKIVIGGAFTTLMPLQPTATTTAVTRSYIARLNADGTIDTGYNPTASATVSALVLQPDGMLLAGGSFTTFTPGATGSAVTRSYIARLKADGTLDTFDPAASAAVTTIALFPSAGGEIKVIVGGSFNSFAPNSIGITTGRNYIARLNADGTVDSNFNPNANSTVNSVAVQSDSSVVFAGAFTAVQPNGAAEATTRNHIARVDFSGALDTAFNPDANGSVEVVSVRPDGSLLVGGTLSTVRPNGVMLLGGKFTTIGGTASPYLALINDDGTVSTAFQPKPNAAVTSLLTLPGGSTLVGGEFTTIAGAPRNRLARFSNDGTLDPGFNPIFNGPVNALALQGDSSAGVLVGGSFTSVGTTARANLVRLLPDGSADAAFAPTVGAVSAIAVQGDGRIVVLAAGSGVRHIVTRFNANGTPDTTFTSFNGGSAEIRSIAVQADGRILVGGAFTGFIARLNANGTVDTTFNPQPDGAVTAITLQTDGRVLIGGNFTRVGTFLRAGLARLSASSPAAQFLGVNAAGTTVTWNRAGTAPEVSSVTFARSDDAITWTNLGTAARAAGTTTWSATASLPATTNSFYLRARAIVASGGGGSSGLTESIQEINFANKLAAEVPLQVIALPPTTPPGTTPPVTVPPTGGAPVSGFRVLADTASLNQAIATAQLATTPGSANLARLSNLSTRARIAPDNILATGFAISGTGERTVLVRAVGPGLTAFGVANALAAPVLRLFDANGNTLVENNGWAGSAAVAQAAAVSGGFPLAAGSADAAIVVTLAPGAYTIQVTDANDTAGGIALAEVYDVAGGSASRLANVSSRSNLTAADGLLISGFVVAGSATSENLLVRGVGPALTQFGVAGAIADPTVGIFDSAGRVVAANDNWSTNAATKTALVASASSVGAFALTDGSKDAAVVLTLAPGAYTAQVSAASGNPGGALLEIYELK